MSKEKAALLHCYLADRENSEKPDRLTRIGILAAAELYRNGKIGTICLTAKEELSGPQAKRLETLLARPPEGDIVVEASTVSTKEEVETFAKLAEEKTWGDLMTIGNSVHLTRIKKEINKAFGDGEVEVKSAKEILSEYPRYSSILTASEEWPEQKSLAFQEKILNNMVLGGLVLRVAPYMSRFKIALQSWAFRQFENRHTQKVD